MSQIEVKITPLPHFADLPLPQYETADSSGMDLRAAVSADVILKAGQRLLIETGIAIAMPSGVEAQIRPRSGLAVKHGISMVNAPGTIDADYRGEIKVILINLGSEDFTISRGMRIAQMVFAPVLKARLNLADNLQETTRGSGGFGHTGV